MYFSNAGPLTAELSANVRDVLEEPDSPFCAKFNSRERRCILSETTRITSLCSDCVEFFRFFKTCLRL